MPDHTYFANLIWPTKPKVLAEYARIKDRFKGEALDARLNKVAGQRFHNHSPLDFDKLKGDPDHIAQHLVSYIKGFSANVRRIFEYFEFETEIEKMREANILYHVVSQFCDVDLHPDRVPNAQMGLIFENLIRRFNELANETAGDHFTPREVIRLMVSILFIHDDELLATPGTVRKLLDPACGTGGMLAEAQNWLREHHPQARLYVYGQDYNKRAFATAASDMLIKQVDHNGGGDHIRFGDSFTEDRFAGETFDYFLTNPPFGVDWKKQQKEIEREHEKQGFAGRFGAGLPRVNDGSLLFLQHMIAKFEPVEPKQHKHGSRLAIVVSGSPLFTAGPGSGESEIRKWIIENDWLEAIIALPEQMFYNTGIGTYIWIVTNRKEKRRKGKIQLIDARDLWTPGGSEDSKRSLGDKRRHLSAAQIEEIVRLYGRFEENERCKIFENRDFGYTRVTVERPLRLAYRMTAENKARFLDACPHLLDDIEAIDQALGREPITNAVMHRDWFIEGAIVFVEIYDDRIEVVGPGGLPKGMTLADLGRKSVRRNALIADLLHRIGFIEKAGTGIKRIRDEAREGGYPEPVWEANGFVTTIFRPNAEFGRWPRPRHPASTRQVPSKCPPSTPQVPDKPRPKRPQSCSRQWRERFSGRVPINLVQGRS